MTILLILFACCFTALMFIKMLLPFLQDHEAQLRFEVMDEDLKTYEVLTQQKAMCIQQLKEIEGDVLSTKLEKADYVQLKRRYEREIILIMRKLEELHGGKGWEERVQLAYTTHRDAKPATTHPVEELGSLTALNDVLQTPEHVVDHFWDAPLEEVTDVLLCTSCKSELLPTDKFCSQCATPVATWSNTTDDEESHKETEAMS